MSVEAIQTIRLTASIDVAERINLKSIYNQLCNDVNQITKTYERTPKALAINQKIRG